MFVRVASVTGLALAAGLAAAAVAGAVAFPPDGLSAGIAVVAVGFLPVPVAGLLLARSAPRNAVGWIFLGAGVSLSLACACLVVTRAALVHGVTGVPAPETIALIGAMAWVGGVPLMSTFGLQLFPDGRPHWRALAWLSGAALALCVLFAGFAPDMLDYPERVNRFSLGGWVNGAVVGVVALAPLSLAGAAALRARARTEPSPARAGALRALAACGVLVAASYVACIALNDVLGAWITVAEAACALAYAAVAAAGIARHGVGDLRLVAGRGLLFATLSGLAVGLYLALAALVSGALGGVLATLLAVLAALALGRPVRRGINRLVYGLREEPGAALASLGGRLQAAAALPEVLPAAARTVAGALRLPFVAIDVGGATLAAHGVAGRGRAETIPLVFAGEAIGSLRLESRVGDGGFSAADRRLLDELAGNVAVAAHAVQVSRALETSRARLLGAREEERRRLRSDLHDGLGPTLFGLALGMDGVARALPPERAAEIARLERLREAAEGAVADVRRLIDDLRPPVLDHLGLAGAVGEQARRLGATVIEVPATVPPLSPAVEVTAYRIAAEAMANAVRHAAGAAFELRLRIDGDLHLDVLDDGPGLPEAYRAGVGISSMRERAALLGGSCVVERRRPGGTAVRVRLPLAEP